MPGAEVDLSLGPVEVMASVAAGLNKLSSRMDRAEQAWRERERKRARTPQQVRLFATANCPTPTAPFNIPLPDSPSAGYFWLVRRLIIGGTQWVTTAAGTAEAYITGYQPAVGSVGPPANIRSLTDLFDQAASLPSKAFYSNIQGIVLAGENLDVVIVGGTAGQAYSISALIELHRTLAEEEVSSI